MCGVFWMVACKSGGAGEWRAPWRGSGNHERGPRGHWRPPQRMRWQGALWGWNKCVYVWDLFLVTVLVIKRTEWHWTRYSVSHGFSSSEGDYIIKFSKRSLGNTHPPIICVCVTFSRLCMHLLSCGQPTRGPTLTFMLELKMLYVPPSKKVFMPTIHWYIDFSSPGLYSLVVTGWLRWALLGQVGPQAPGQVWVCFLCVLGPGWWPSLLRP